MLLFTEPQGKMEMGATGCLPASARVGKPPVAPDRSSLDFGFSIRHASHRPGMDLTPLVIVCLLVILFLMLLVRLSYLESDAAAAPSATKTSSAQLKATGPAIRVRLTADAQGELTGIRMDDRSVGSLQELQDQIRRSALDVGAPAEVEFDCDYRLRYAHILRAIATVSSYRADDGKTMLPLVEKVKFAAPHREQVP